MEAISTDAINSLIIEPQWFDDLKWLSAALDLAQSHGISTWMLVGYLKPRLVSIGTQGFDRLFDHDGASAMCVQYSADTRTVWHGGVRIELALRPWQLLTILTADAGRAVRLPDINREAETRGVARFTYDTLKANVRQIRFALGNMRHVMTLRGYGYVFRSCRLADLRDPDGLTPPELTGR